jgi:hypothetical protein
VNLCLRASDGSRPPWRHLSARACSRRHRSGLLPVICSKRAYPDPSTDPNACQKPRAPRGKFAHVGEARRKCFGVGAALGGREFPRLRLKAKPIAPFRRSRACAATSPVHTAARNCHRGSRPAPLLPARPSYGSDWRVSQLSDFCCAGRGDPVRRSRLRPGADAGTR